jgi:hypothetical protein
MEPWVRSAVRIFGPQRCMFAAHFPTDRLLWSYDELIQALLAILDDLTGGGGRPSSPGALYASISPRPGRSERRASSQCPRFHPG